MNTLGNVENYLSLGKDADHRLLYIKSGREDYFYSVSFRDFCIALSFLSVHSNIVLQTAHRSTIPYVRRLIFRVLGQPDSESATNTFKYGPKQIKVVHWGAGNYEHELQALKGFAKEQQMYYLSTDDEIYSFEQHKELPVYPTTDPYYL